MKILVITGALDRSSGGLFYSVKSLANRWALSEDVTVVGYSVSHQLDLETWRVTQLLNLNFRPLNWLRGIFILIQMQPDLIYVNGAWNLHYIIMRFFLLKSNIVVAPRGMFDEWALSKRSVIKKTLIKFLYRSDKIRYHALNASEKQSIHKALCDEDKTVLVYPNGIEQVNFSEPNKVFSRFLYIGRIHPKKNLEYFIELFKDVNFKYTIDIAGWGEEEYVKSLISSMSEEGLNIKFHGSAYNEEKARLFEQADIFLLPSFSEGLPMAVLEAWSYGLPTCITEYCNLSDFFAYDFCHKLQLDPLVDRQIINSLTAGYEIDYLEMSRIISEYFLWDKIADQMLTACKPK